MTDATFIHPTAVVETGARLGSGVHVGPFCHVEAAAVLGDRVRLIGHVSVLGPTTLGEGCTVHPTATLGGPPQSIRHKGEPTTLVIGSNCTIREGVTMNRGTAASRGETLVGDNGFFLAYVHIAHDCVVGNNVVMANNATLAGHVDVGDFVNFGGMSAVHQGARIGHHAFVGGAAAVERDVIPYGMAVGNRAVLRGLNVIGMKRSGIARAEIHDVRKACRIIFDRARPISENLPLAAAAFPDFAAIADLLQFLSASKRRFVTPPLGAGALEDDEDD